MMLSIQREISEKKLEIARKFIKQHAKAERELEDPNFPDGIDINDMWLYFEDNDVVASRDSEDPDILFLLHYFTLNPPEHPLLKIEGDCDSVVFLINTSLEDKKEEDDE